MHMSSDDEIPEKKASLKVIEMQVFASNAPQIKNHPFIVKQHDPPAITPEQKITSCNSHLPHIYTIASVDKINGEKSK